MRATPYENPIEALSPITDAEAAATVSPETLADLADAIMAVPAPSPGRDRSRVPTSPGHDRSRVPTRVRARRPTLALTLAAAATAAVLVIVTGALSGHGAGVAPADAAILRGANAALHPQGSVVVESFTSGPPGGRDAQRVSDILETPSGSGPQNELMLEESSLAPGAEIGLFNGDNELYDPATNTVYLSNNYAPYITPGTAPGTYVYRVPAQNQPLPPHEPVVPDPLGPVPPLTITAAQAQALRDGTAEVMVIGSGGHYRMKVTSFFRVPSASAVVHTQLGRLRVAGTTTVNGRKAIKLVPVHGAGEYDVEPGTYFPIREIMPTEGPEWITTWSRYRVRPAQTDQWRLDLLARHPGARVDRSTPDFLRAYRRLITGD